jgi:hypothetical protein
MPDRVLEMMALYPLPVRTQSGASNTCQYRGRRLRAQETMPRVSLAAARCATGRPPANIIRRSKAHCAASRSAASSPRLTG